MSHRIRRVEYFYGSTPDQPGRSLSLLSALADLGIDLLAFNTMPVGPEHTQVTLFPESPARLTTEAARLGLPLDGPHPAILIQGDDRIGALVEVHQRLADEGINVYASNGVTDGTGRFGYLLYLRPDDVARAEEALGI